MDAIILAAGRGERVKDLVPAFHKPLLTAVDGTPLVCHAVDLAIEAGVDTPVVVVAPSNAEAIHGALGDRRSSLVIQRAPLGPGHALLIGLSVHPRPYFTSDRVLVMLSDNVMTEGDVRAVTGFETAVGVKSMNRREAQRFTRFEHGMWIEKTAIANLDGPPLPCWVGPIVVWRVNAVRTLRSVWHETEVQLAKDLTHTEMLIGPYLGSLMKDRIDNLVPVSSFDVGTIEAYRRFTSE